MIKFLLHLRPKRIPAEALHIKKTFGLGGILTYLFIIEVVSGILLMFYYTPSVDQAFFDIKKITNVIPYGYFLRSIHRLSGELMIIIGFLHMLRIVIQKSYNTKVRVKNWIYGVLLFLLIFPLNFTGYLLPFDTISYWGATIVLNVISEIPLIGNFLRLLISGSYYIDGNVLIRFYTYHIVVLPLIFILILSLHFYYVRNAGGIKVKDSMKKVDATILFKIEAISILILTLFLLIFTIKFYSPPLGNYALTSNIPKIIKAPWYFLNLQYLLKFLSSNIIVLMVFLYTFYLIFFPKIKNRISFLVLHFIIILLIFLFR